MMPVVPPPTADSLPLERIAAAFESIVEILRELLELAKKEDAA